MADLSAIASGDRLALKRLYAATSAKLFGICFRILGNEGEAEDVLQEVYLTVWRRAGAFDPARGVSPITWLAAIARNRAIDRLRASASRATAGPEGLELVRDGAPLASERLEILQQSARLNACLEALEPAQAGAVRGAFFAGLTYADLADRAGVPLGTMKSWIRRSLQRLKTCLDT